MCRQRERAQGASREKGGRGGGIRRRWRSRFRVGWSVDCNHVSAQPPYLPRRPPSRRSLCPARFASRFSVPPRFEGRA